MNRYSLRDESGQTFAELALAAAIVIVIAVVVIVVVAHGRSHGPGAFQRANMVCGKAKPVRIVQHVHEFPSDNWLAVHCSDGTMRAVKGG